MGSYNGPEVTDTPSNDYYINATVLKDAAKMFPNAVDAIVVARWFGRTLSDPLNQILLKGREAELLAKAREMQEEHEKKLAKKA